MKDLTVGKESSLIFKFALPMLAGNLFQQLYNIVDSIIVGNYLGKEALAAVGASFPIIFVLISLVIGIATGMTIVISQYFGAKDFEKVKRAIDTVFIFSFFASLVLMAVGLIFSRQIFVAIKLPEEVIPDAVSYLNVFMMGMVLMFGFNATSAVLRGMGDSKTPLVFMIISTVLNIGLDCLFVIGFGWGITSVAVATVISQGVAFIIGVIYLNRSHDLIRFSFRNIVFDTDIFRKSLKIGIPSGLQQTFVALGMMAVLRIVNDFGTNTVAAYTVAVRIDSLASMPAMNFSAALATFVGQNLGANKPGRVRRGFFATWWMTSVISLLVMALVYFAGEQLMMLFNSDPEVVEIGRRYLLIVGSFYILFSSMFSTNGVLRGAGDTIIPMFITLFSLWIVRVPLSYFLSRPSVGLGEEGIWWGIPLAWAVGMVFSYMYYLTGRWKRKVVVKHDKASIE